MQWPLLRRLDLRESLSRYDSEDEDSDEDEPNLSPYLQQLSSTSLYHLHTLDIEVRSSTRLDLVEKILSCGRIAHLDIFGSDLDGDQTDRYEAAVRAVAGRLKTFGIFSKYYRPSSVIELYGLLSKCDTLTIEPGDPGTISFPTTTQLPSLRTLHVYALTPDHLESLETFILGRRTPLEVLQIDCDGDYQELREICEGLGTKLQEL